MKTNKAKTLRQIKAELAFSQLDITPTRQLTLAERIHYKCEQYKWFMHGLYLRVRYCLQLRSDRKRIRILQDRMTEYLHDESSKESSFTYLGVRIQPDTEVQICSCPEPKIRFGNYNTCRICGRLIGAKL